MRKIKYSRPNHNRERIIKENLLQYRDAIKLSDRNKEIVKSYAEGVSYKELAAQYRITNTRVAQIVQEYIRHCGLYKKGVYCYKNHNSSHEETNK